MSGLIAGSTPKFLARIKDQAGVQLDPTIIKSVNRAVTNNVATIETNITHGLSVGDPVTIIGMGGTGYNGKRVVTVVPDTIHFKFDLTHDDESETADTAGTIGKEIIEVRILLYNSICGTVFARFYLNNLPTPSEGWRQSTIKEGGTGDKRILFTLTAAETTLALSNKNEIQISTIIPDVDFEDGQCIIIQKGRFPEIKPSKT